MAAHTRSVRRSVSRAGCARFGQRQHADRLGEHLPAIDEGCERQRRRGGGQRRDEKRARFLAHGPATLAETEGARRKQVALTQEAVAYFARLSRAMVKAASG